ncbi:ionotropic receptor 21a [Pararge aegeria]|uniref:ionotropic receptor 21a n=1 Tax=Pararge aegeria TaxID=116150 RepID=UPI0019D2B0B1|nr:ionotropic receptor 21a [Pararge aegeria]
MPPIYQRRTHLVQGAPFSPKTYFKRAILKCPRIYHPEVLIESIGGGYARATTDCPAKNQLRVSDDLSQPLRHLTFCNITSSQKYEERIQKSFQMNNPNNLHKLLTKRLADPIFHGHPKTREEVWHDNFLNQSKVFDQNPSLIKLIHNITLTHLNDCTPVILYDNQIKSHESQLFQDLFKSFPVTFVHGYIDEKDKLEEPKLLQARQECLHFILFLTDVQKSAKILGKQSESKVIVVARSSQWAVQEFLSGPISRYFINLLVIGQSFKDDDNLETPYILYTHVLYIDGLGASKPQVLCSWNHGRYSRNVDLFPTKMNKGYAGHRFIIAAANQPPFIFRRIQTDSDGGNPRVVWDGIEVRILNLLAERNNFTVEIVEPHAVSREIILGRADIGVAGLYVTSERIRDMDMSFPHYQDCAVFITLTSTALPRYRAILGPFHWHVWVTLTFTYLFGIFPLAFSDKHTLRHLLQDKGEVENMFWYVFGTFTNCFTFVGKNSWSKTTKITTRLLIGWYWLFTIIITSCYTGSIIAFVTLPIFPDTVDSIKQLLSGFYRVGTLDRGGWERWFFNSSDPLTNKLLKKIEFVPNVGAGIRNTTKAFFWPYAFLGSKAELEYIVQANFTKVESKRSVLHVSNECFVFFGVSLSFPNKSLYSAKLSNDISRMSQSGIIDKLIDEVRWEMQRSSSGRLLSVGRESSQLGSLEEKGLTLEDTQGMFLLLGAGLLIAATALLSEWMGGFSRRCCMLRKKLTTNRNSNQSLIHITKTSVQSKINDSMDSILHFDARSPSMESIDTLDGQIINVSQDNITIHNDGDEKADSRRSSSVDLDKQVKDIFERDEFRRRVVLEEIVSMQDKREDTASKGVFGDRVIE